MRRALMLVALLGCEPTPEGPTDAPVRDGGRLVDGGSVDAGEVDAPVDGGRATDAGAPPACPVSAYLCEDFESGAPGPDWSLEVVDATEMVVHDDARGSEVWSVHVEPLGGARALLRTEAPFPVAGSSLFGRAWVRLTGPAPTVHAGLFATAGGDVEVRLGLGPALLPNYAGPGVEYGSWAPDPPLMPVDRWTCIEWSLEDTAGDHDRLLYWIDGAEAVAHEIDGSGGDAWTFPTFERFELGMLLYHEPAEGYDVRYDDVVLSPTRVGCD